MNNSLAYVGHEEEIARLGDLFLARRCVLLVGPAGAGKTALFRRIRQQCPMLLCEETSSLRRICDGLEQQLGWTHYKMNVVERKNRLLHYLARRGEVVALDHVARTPPRVARFIERLSESVPVWIACRSDQPHDIGRVWEYLYKCVRVEVPPLTRHDAKLLIERAVAFGSIQSQAKEHVGQLYRLSKGNPRILEEFLIELADRKYDMEKRFGWHLLDIDRRIHEVTHDAARVSAQAMCVFEKREGV
jgi:hypothetical protein